MAQCAYCHRMFRSEQSVKAHLKHCYQYKSRPRKNSSALGTVPKAEERSHAPAKLKSEVSKRSDEETCARQTRRTLLQAVKDQVIDQYWTSSGTVTSTMRGAAKASIERELATLPVEELPFPEVLELTAAIRDRHYAPLFREEAQQTKRQQDEQEKQRNEELKKLSAMQQMARRKRLLIQQASRKAQASCAEREIKGWAQLSVLGDIESHLTELLTGEETVPEAQSIVQCVLDARFGEEDAKRAAAKVKEEQEWCDALYGVAALGTLAGLVVLVQRFPEQALLVLNWIERIFMSNQEPTPHSPTKESSETTTDKGSSEPPRRRRHSSSNQPRTPEASSGMPPT